LKKIVLILVSTAALGATARAADLPMKAPAAPAPAVYGWSGWYFGGNVGYGWGKADTDTTLSGFAFAPLVHSDRLKPKGVNGGVQLGYNAQVSPNWVIGLEADWQGSAAKASQSYSDPYFFGIGLGTATTNFDAKIDWFGTARGRVGYAWNGVLLYATGGLAYGEVKLAGTESDAGISIGGPFGAASSFGASKVRAGWTAGGGIEGALSRNWTWKAEYLYLDLGSLSFVSPGPFSGETVAQRAKFTDNVVRLGLNFQLH
jgi:outer membrane immunogenic protein